LGIEKGVMSGDFSAVGEFDHLDGTTATPSREQRETTRLFALFRDPVYRYFRRVLGSREEAEDLTQEVFLRLYRTLQQGQDIENARGWIFRVAHNLAVNEGKRESRPDLSDSALGIDRADLATEDSSPSAEQKLLDDERRRRVRTKLGQLSPRQRQCLELRAEGLRYREIADALGIRIPTVVTFLTRALRKIAEEGDA
jgi:RNA polymerase sigma-70 factor (ECF subfamily)